MLIRSSFTDYYDGIAGTGVDRSIQYLRYPKIIQADGNFFVDRLPAHFPDDLGEVNEYSYSDAEIARWNLKETCNFHIIGFCGTHLVCATNPYSSIVYYGEKILGLDWSQKQQYRQPSDRQIVEDCLTRFHDRHDDRLFQQFGAPIFHTSIAIRRSARDRSQLLLSDFNVNPCLNELQFYKYKDTYSAFQLIQSYISGVLGTDSQPMVEISNNSKITKAGFDLKTSFRKGKQ